MSNANNTKIFAVSGIKNSGKTTLICALTEELKSRGMKVAAIKHEGHEFEPDTPGTDSYKIRKSGAYATAVISSGKVLIVKENSGMDELDVAALFPEADIIILEGYKYSSYPKLEVVRKENSDAPVCDPSTMFALVTDFTRDKLPEKYSDIPLFHPDDIKGIADKICSVSDREKVKKFGTAAILAGGRSSRMGMDKQYLSIDNNYIFRNNIEKLRELFDEIIVVTNTPELYEGTDVRTCSDIYPGKGPLSGIHAALSISESDYIYLVACDMPVMNTDYASYLKSIADESSADAVVSEINGRMEIFNAFYSKNIYDRLEETLKGISGDKSPSVFRFITSGDISYHIVDEETVRDFDSELLLFENLNTKEDCMRFAELTDSDVNCEKQM